MDIAANLTNETNVNFSVITTPVYLYVWITVANIVVFMTGVFGNCMVITVVICFKEMRTPINYCLVNLGVADFLVLVVCQTSALLEFYAQDRWLLGRFFCKLVPFLECLVTHASILIMLGISIGRYNAVYRPLQSHASYSRSKSLKLMGLLWILAGMTAIPFLIFTDIEEALFHKDGSVVNICRSQIVKTWHYIYLLSLNFALFVCPLLILFVLYYLILCKIFGKSSEKVKRHANKSKLTYSKRQLTLMFCAIVFLFFVCVLPMRVVSTWIVFTDPKNIEKLGLEGYVNLIWSARLFLYVNSTVNPIIYSIFSENFRNTFKVIVGLKTNILVNRRHETRFRSSRYFSSQECTV